MLREEIVAAGREILRSGQVVGTWGNVSARESAGNAYWITPTAMGYETLTVEDLVLLNLDQQIVQGRRKPSSESLLHQEIYRSRSDVQGIVHTHSIYASALAVAGVPLPGITADLAQITGAPILVAPFELPGSRELAQRAVEALENRNAVLLANHGMIGVGRDVAEAVRVCQVVEKSAQIYCVAQALAKPQEINQRQLDVLRDKYLFDYKQ
ncbi:MAG: class II aldolase/adducin family protein [Peptococcaceae bacterium]|jgi:L-fuculose-phosphate aldolase|nr:class II aldolase/adducin family protein [Peptococcaceae bacterium]